MEAYVEVFNSKFDRVVVLISEICLYAICGSLSQDELYQILGDLEI